MSKHWRMLLGATLAVTNRAGMAIVAFAQPEAHDAINQGWPSKAAPTPDKRWRRWSHRRQPSTERQVGESYRYSHDALALAAQAQTITDRRSSWPRPATQQPRRK